MEERLAKVENELAEIKEFITQLTSLFKTFSTKEEASLRFTKSVGDFMEETSKRIVEIEESVIELDNIRSEQIEGITSNITKLTEITTSTIDLITASK